MALGEVQSKQWNLDTLKSCKFFQTFFIFGLKKGVYIIVKSRMWFYLQDGSLLDRLRCFIFFDSVFGSEIICDLKKLVILKNFLSFFIEIFYGFSQELTPCQNGESTRKI